MIWIYSCYKVFHQRDVEILRNAVHELNGQQKSFHYDHIFAVLKIIIVN